MTTVIKPTTAPRPTGPADPFELSTEMLIMLGSTGFVIVVLGVMAKKRGKTRRGVLFAPLSLFSLLFLWNFLPVIQKSFDSNVCEWMIDHFV